MNWHTIEFDNDSTRETIHAHVEIPSESQWFNGHFPDEPILPGFAILSMVFDAVSLSTKDALVLKEFKKIRFKQVITPGNRIEIHATQQDDPDTYSFTVYADSNQACKGSLTVGRLNKT